MTTKNSKVGIGINGRTEIYVPHNEELLTFVYLTKGTSTYAEIMEHLTKEKLLMPTTAQLFSLLDLALQDPENFYYSGILNEFNSNFLWTSTENLFLTDGGVMVYDNTSNNMSVSKEDLIERLSSGDKTVRFVPSGFRTGCISLQDFLEHPYLIAQVGEDMLKTVERVAKNYNNTKADIFCLNKPDIDIKQCTQVDSYSGKLCISVTYCDNELDTCVLGILHQKR